MVSTPVWWPTSLVDPEGHLHAACRPPPTSFTLLLLGCELAGPGQLHAEPQHLARGGMILLKCVLGRRRMILLGFSLQLPFAALTISLPDAATS